MRTFDTGATRDTAEGKPDYVGYISARALRAFGQYMLAHQTQADGRTRASDNWKKGMAPSVYLSSLLRHTVELLEEVEEGEGRDDAAVQTCCAMWFNIQGYLHEILGPEEGR